MGGAENYVSDVSNSLHEMGYTVHVASRTGLRNRELNPSIKHHYINFRKVHTLPNLVRLIKLIRKEKFDIIHAHQRNPILVGCLASFFSGIPVITTVHGKWRDDIGSKFVQKRLKGIIVTSRNSWDGVKESSLLRKKTDIIPCGLNNISKVSKNYSKMKILYACRVDKNHYNLLRLIIMDVFPALRKIFPELDLEIIGNGSSMLSLSQLVKETKQRLGKECIKLTGYLPDITEKIASAGCVLGVGQVALRSLALGVPVLSINNKYLGEPIVSENYEYYHYNNFVAVDFGSPNSSLIIKYLSDILENYDFYKNEAVQIMPHAIEEFNMKRVAGKIIGKYREALK
ncbi:MAG: hypothetical protein A2V66_05515 [Ignavibacteria bacterium RBG_13_36_8]|nr:MAG: hypothetical protein A2V66_05515 [Ignavibacteria bacterium RBG_13_36_8]